MLKLWFILGIAMVISFVATHNLNSNVTVSLKQFTIFNKLGAREYGSVYVAKKNGGADDGKLYALKAINITDAHVKNELPDKEPLNTEREILEAIRGLQCVTKLHYAFREGTWLFLVMDFVAGENFHSKLLIDLPDAITMRLILAEIVIIVEELHNVNVLHGDLHAENILINSDGHFVLTDFGFSNWFSSNKVSELDWSQLSQMCHHIFSEPIEHVHELSLIKMLANMTDAQLPDLKNHSFFNGIVWECVKRRSKPIFKSIEMEFNLVEHPLDIVAELQINIDNKIEANLIDRFSNYTFIGCEHFEPKPSVSLKHFSVHNELGKGSYGTVFLAKKIMGSDHGRLYALKAINIRYAQTMKKYFGRDSVDNERNILEAVRGLPCAAGLHYAFREGTWLFLVMDHVAGENLRSKLDVIAPDANIARLILAELIVAVEKLHELNIQHGDLASAKNILINNRGHLVLIDFGFSQRIPAKQKPKTNDWHLISRMCRIIFRKLNKNEIALSLERMLANMTDLQLPDLKNHPFFDGINWKMVAENAFDPPYESIEIQTNLDKPIDLAALLGDGINDELDDTLHNRFRNYSFVAPEHCI